MTIWSIVHDAIRYPLSDWKRYLILGIIFLMVDLVYITRFDGSIVITTNIALEWFLGIITFTITLLTRGYFLRIIKSSLNDVTEPPKFNKLTCMFKDGVKYFIVSIVYLIPAILFIIGYAILSYSSHPLTVINTLSGTTIWFLIGGTAYHALQAWIGVLYILPLLYIIIITPIIAMAFAHMANNENKLLTAFKFREILKSIALKGWGNFIKWYILTGILFFILLFVIGIPIYIFATIIQTFLGAIPIQIIMDLLGALFILPYLYMYMGRSIALFYKSNKNSLSSPKNSY